MVINRPMLLFNGIFISGVTMGVLYRYYHVFSQNFTGQCDNGGATALGELGGGFLGDVITPASKILAKYMIITI